MSSISTALSAVTGTKKELAKKLVELQHQVNEGVHADPSRLTVGQYLDRWLDQTSANRGLKTTERCAEIITNHLIPALVHIKLSRLTCFQVQQY